MFMPTFLWGPLWLFVHVIGFVIHVIHVICYTTFLVASFSHLFITDEIIPPTIFIEFNFFQRITYNSITDKSVSTSNSCS